MSTVYCIYRSDGYESTNALKVFSTKEKAVNYCEEQNKLIDSRNAVMNAMYDLYEEWISENPYPEKQRSYQSGVDFVNRYLNNIRDTQNLDEVEQYEEIRTLHAKPFVEMYRKAFAEIGIEIPVDTKLNDILEFWINPDYYYFKDVEFE